METIANTTLMSFRVNKDLKNSADALFRSLGMNTSVALNIFLIQCVKEQGIPFPLTTKIIPFDYQNTHKKEES